jgi:hypothetical protein
LFWNGKKESLYATHHSSTKQKEEARGYVIDSDVAEQATALIKQPSIPR